jgi:glycosyltransferase involved in cell wall biosynthesis
VYPLASLQNNLKDDAEYEHYNKKIDLTIWTLNSAKTLPFTLMSIEKAIPRERVNQKLMVDGHSTDETQNIGKQFGWKVIDAEKVGIPHQANQALEMVNTEVFASFEHDIILNRNWFQAIMRHLLSDPQVAVAQGVRLATNPVFKKIEEFCLERNIRYSSIDNNLYRTELIRSIGGFDFRFPISCDRNLQDRVRKAGYKWIIDKTVVSDHIRGDVLESANHVYELSKFVDHPDCPSMSSVLSKFMFSPIRGVEISIKKECPQALVVYPYWRFMLLKSSLKMLQNRSKPEVMR